MTEKLRSGWEQIRKYRRAIGVVAMVLIIVVVIALIIAVVLSNGTGFNGYNKVSTVYTISGPSTGTVTRTEEYQPGKSLWDLLQLLIIPVVLAVGGFWLNQIQKSREEKASEQRTKTEQDAAEKRAQTEQEIALGNQQEMALQTYLDRMSELLLEKRLDDPDTTDIEVRKIARVRTLTILSRLDGGRRGTVLRFLYDSGLIVKDKCIIDLTGANLSKADLSKANLSGADLSDADLSDADLSRANLSGATVTNEQLAGAKSLQGATMPDGSKHP